MAVWDRKRRLKIVRIVAALAALACGMAAIMALRDGSALGVLPVGVVEESYIRWVDFNVTADAMEKALDCELKARDQNLTVRWVDLLAVLGAQYGGNFKRYRSGDMDALMAKIKQGQSIEQIGAGYKQYAYYKEAYGAVLDGLVGLYYTQTDGGDGQTVWEERYGLKGFCPIAGGYSFSHYDDFGNARNYGFDRLHLGNDLLANVGTPVIAVESGVVQEMGWNQYGGWRIGIRSLDGKRYYYYAHLRQNRPFHADLMLGQTVQAGSVIGYVGRTGYSKKENVNNITRYHLHFGLQLIFHPSQEDGPGEIWVDVYELVEFLQRNRAKIYRVDATKEYYPQNPICDLPGGPAE